MLGLEFAFVLVGIVGEFPRVAGERILEFRSFEKGLLETAAGPQLRQSASNQKERGNEFLRDLD